MNASLTAADMDRVRKRSPLGRFVLPMEVAGTVEFLLGDAAAGITGTVLTVDAGSTA
jgi:3-oxoacyl-[acyl-carrier protein] reductase